MPVENCRENNWTVWRHLWTTPSWITHTFHATAFVGCMPPPPLSVNMLHFMKKCSLWAAVTTDVSESVILSRAKKWYQQVDVCVRATAAVNALWSAQVGLSTKDQTDYKGKNWLNQICQRTVTNWMTGQNCISTTWHKCYRFIRHPDLIRCT